METDAIIRRQGNSIGLVLPQTVLRETGFTVGQTVSLEATTESLIIKAKRKRYTAAELNALCDPDAALPTDLQEWDDMPDMKAVPAMVIDDAMARLQAALDPESR